MLYQNYQLLANFNDPVRLFAEQARQFMSHLPGASQLPSVKRMAAYWEQIALLGFTNRRPDYAIEPVAGEGGKLVPVRQELVHSTPFCDLLCFRKDSKQAMPKVLLVAPMSGHFATLLRGTVQTLVQDHEVYLTDWLNIRDIPAAKGVFDLDAYVEHIQIFLRFLGPRTHLMGVCQPTVACLAAASVMAEDKDECTPASLVLMAGPIDTRINPTTVNELAVSKPIEWFEAKLIGTVPFQFAGGGRRVYPGFVQLMAFMSMNPERHRSSFKELFNLRVKSEDTQADLIKEFYEEYFAIMDLSAPYYLQTVNKVFQRHQLPKGELTFQGRPVRPQALRKTFLLTVEGERDDICGIGQTLAAQDLCSGLPGYRKSHHLQAGVGHYGVFSGKRWAASTYPVVRALIQSAN